MNKEILNHLCVLALLVCVACSGSPLREFSWQEEAQQIDLALFADSTFQQTIEGGESSETYAGKWSGSLQEDSLFSTIATHRDGQIITLTPASHYQVRGGQAIRIEPPAPEADPLFGQRAFDPKLPYSIVGLEKSNDLLSSAKDTTICREWKLGDAEIREILGSGRVINGPEWHHLFDYLPCRITANLQQGPQEFDLSINAGAWFTISSTDTVIRYGSFEETTNPFFLSTVWIEEQEGEE